MPLAKVVSPWGVIVAVAFDGKAVEVYKIIEARIDLNDSIVA